MNLLFASDDRNTGASASASVLPVNIQGWSPLRLIGLNSLLSKGFSGAFSGTFQKLQFFLHSAFFMVQLSQLYVTAGKTIALTIWTFVSRVMSLIYYTLSLSSFSCQRNLVKPSFTLWKTIICEEKFSWLCKDSKNTLFIVWVESYFSLS